MRVRGGGKLYIGRGIPRQDRCFVMESDKHLGASRGTQVYTGTGTRKERYAVDYYIS